MHLAELADAISTKLKQMTGATTIRATSLALLLAGIGVHAQEPPLRPSMAESPGIKILRGLTVPEFENEMRNFVEALGVTCNYCHVRGNFPSDQNPHKVAARRMLEMTKTINQQFFPDFTPSDNESRLGRVTCFTCHQGSEKPKSPQ